jgi:hypothetical protein
MGQQSEPVFAYSRLGYKITLFHNRIVIAKKEIVFLPAKERSVALSTITSLDVHRVNRSIVVRTSDGNAVKLEIFGKDADVLREHLERLL